MSHCAPPRVTAVVRILGRSVRSEAPPQRKGQAEVAALTVSRRIAVEAFVNIERPVHVPGQIAAYLAIELQASALTGETDERFGFGGSLGQAVDREPVAGAPREGFHRMIECVAALIVLAVVVETALHREKPAVRLTQVPPDAATNQQPEGEIERLILLHGA